MQDRAFNELKFRLTTIQILELYELGVHNELRVLILLRRRTDAAGLRRPTDASCVLLDQKINQGERKVL